MVISYLVFIFIGIIGICIVNITKENYLLLVGSIGIILITILSLLDEYYYIRRVS